MKIVKLEPKSVADFYAETMGALAELGIAVKIWPMPVEIPSPIRFTEDTAAQVVRSPPRRASGGARWRTAPT